MSDRKRIVIGSRGSVLALIQSELVKKWILQNHPQLLVEIRTYTTTGDRILNKPLERIGGKGLFVKELDAALLAGETDLSVHSLKDLPMELPEELPILACSPREDARDALVLPEGVSTLDLSKPIACGSRRRKLQFQALYPEATFAPIRGNVPTRLQKVDSGSYAGTILAVSGLKRLGLEHRISRIFSAKEMVPAAGQGILAVQGLAGASHPYLLGYSDETTKACAVAERAFVAALGGNCTTPVAAYAKCRGEELLLRCFYYDERTQRSYQREALGRVEDSEELGIRLAKQLLEETNRE